MTNTIAVHIPKYIVIVFTKHTTLGDMNGDCVNANNDDNSIVCATDTYLMMKEKANCERR